jgi:7-carboxy-7-deazaguanine synthase
MAKLKVAEIFYSLQGEGLWGGVPSVFLRTFGCNFQCRGFGLPNGQFSTEPEEFAEQFAQNPGWEYNSLPLAKTGCDSYASWHPKFKSLSPVLDVEKVVDEIELARRGGMPGTQGGHIGSTHLVITGGEPLLGWQRAYPELFDMVYNKGYKHITFETNGTQEITDDFADYLLLRQIKNAKDQNTLTFSVSPKLYMSGEDRSDALKPEIVSSYQRFGKVYLKFVVAEKNDMTDVVDFVQAYRQAGFDGEVYLMPCGGNQDMYNENAPEVAKLAMEYGFRYSPRLQVDLWANAWST